MVSRIKINKVRRLIFDLPFEGGNFLTIIIFTGWGEDFVVELIFAVFAWGTRCQKLGKKLVVQIDPRAQDILISRPNLKISLGYFSSILNCVGISIKIVIPSLA